MEKYKGWLNNLKIRERGSVDRLTKIPAKRREFLENYTHIYEQVIEKKGEEYIQKEKRKFGGSELPKPPSNK